MSFTLDTAYLIAGAIGLILGLLLGYAVWGRHAARSAALLESVGRIEAQRAEDAAERDRLQRDLASARDQVRPLSDEVDRLRREAAKRRTVIAASPDVAERTAAALDAGAVVAPPTAVPAGGQTDRPSDLRLLKGVGDRFAAKLASLGITDIHRAATLSPDEAARIDGQLEAFQGRLARDQVVEQARLLDEGRLTEYEARYGKLGGPIL